jgi:ferritin-like metal-binding protein YciE
VAALLDETLEEESKADSLLSRIAVRAVNVQASHA